MRERSDGATRVARGATDPYPRKPTAAGKFLFVGDDKLYVRGVAYGPFAPSDGTGEVYVPERVARDFADMAATGINAVRTYTVPPRWLLDLAQGHGLFVMVGLPWEQHVAFLEDEARARAIEHRVREGVSGCAGHPALLCYAVGNEIPASIVRWHGRQAVERYIERLYRAAKAEDPEALVTYANYPSTEYLQLPFIDVVCFNVFLESQRPFESYVARLQNIAGDRPLILTELGLDSRRNGLERQASVLERHIRGAFASGCAGTFVFAWTDEWHRGGYDIEDWDFGLTDRRRRPKPALDAVRRAFADVPFPPEAASPRVSVVVCTYNGAETLRDCLEGLERLEYPDFEVIVVSDGSTDATAATAAEYGVRLIETENRGLASARNVGLAAATGEIVAYLDDDARPDPHWLAYLAHAFATTAHASIGGPNVPFPDDGEVEQCVAKVPGGPTHVLVSDTEAEHVPGCNMAFRKECLDAIGGFDPRFKVAGDDVDVCWRIRERAWTIGFSPGAVVWHHRRRSLQGFWRQQRGYGEAEALLERKWPEKYGGDGHVSWAGRLYGDGSHHNGSRGRWRVYYGTWGSGLFQSLYQPADTRLAALLRMPEWYLVILGLAVLSAGGVFWRPLLAAVPALIVAVGALLVDVVVSATGASFPGRARSLRERLRLRALLAFLLLIQPLARLRGRLAGGLTPWRRRQSRKFALPRPGAFAVWSEHWEAPENRLRAVEAGLVASGASVVPGSDYDRWDLEVRAGALGGARLIMGVEEHGAGKQLERVRWWPRCSTPALALVFMLGALALGAGVDSAWFAAVGLGLAAALLAGGIVAQSVAAVASIRGVGERERERASRGPSSKPAGGAEETGGRRSPESRLTA